MSTNRLALLGLAALLFLSSASAQTPPASAPTFEERLAAKVAESRYPVSLKDGAFFERTRKSDLELMRIVHGFDAILVLAGSHPSQMLP